MTPGPWVIREGRCRGETSIWTADGVRCIAQMARSEDAALIAAAPDLLDAILKSDNAHWTPAMRAAMAKALGDKT